MSSGWIITNHDFVIHETPKKAFKELARLTKVTGGKVRFRVMRVKNCDVPQPQASDHQPGVEAAEVDHANS